MSFDLMRNAHLWLGPPMVKPCLLVSLTTKFEYSKCETVKLIIVAERQEDMYLRSFVHFEPAMAFCLLYSNEFHLLFIVVPLTTKQNKNDQTTSNLTAPMNIEVIQTYVHLADKE